MDSVSVWDDRAALQSCWFECETYPTAAYKYPSNDADFLYLTGYRFDIIIYLNFRRINSTNVRPQFVSCF